MSVVRAAKGRREHQTTGHDALVHSQNLAELYAALSDQEAAKAAKAAKDAQAQVKTGKQRFLKRFPDWGKEEGEA